MSGISAQGSTLQIATGSGGAKTITGVQVGYPTILTIAGHGFSNGWVAALAGLTGADAALLNGKSVVVQSKTTNTFAVDVDTTGKTITVGSGTATPVAYTKINGLQTFDGFDGSSSDLDASDFDSTAMEYISGLKDEGKFSFGIKVLRGDAGQVAVRAARTSGALVGLLLTLPDGSAATFNVLVKTMPSSGAVNAVLKGTVDTKISGPVTWS